jgi:hypothetical protein
VGRIKIAIKIRYSRGKRKKNQGHLGQFWNVLSLPHSLSLFLHLKAFSVAAVIFLFGSFCGGGHTTTLNALNDWETFYGKSSYHLFCLSYFHKSHSCNASIKKVYFLLSQHFHPFILLFIK